jgi:hypothetical protein
LFASGLAPILRLLKIGTNSSAAKFVLTFIAVFSIRFIAYGDDDDVAATNLWTAQNARFGPFDCLDHRSGYYGDAFPQGLLVEDTSAEQEGELELNYLHTGAGKKKDDVISAEAQKSLGVFTFELEVPYERTVRSHGKLEGVGDIEVNTRSPLYQYVTANGLFDTTAGVGVDVGIPVNSPVSKNTELEPGIFDDFKIGNHFTVQATLAYDKLFGGGSDGGEEDFEYGMDFAWAVPHTELPIPGVDRISPMFEIDGELGLNMDEANQNNVLGGAGFRMDFKSVCNLQPSLGLSYIFPMSAVARKDVRWGFATSFTVEF